MPATADTGTGRGDVPATILVDTHAHLWDLFSLERFLEASARNFSRALKTLGTVGPSTWCLVLADARGGESRERLERSATRGAPEGQWVVRPRGGDGSYEASRDGTARILLVPGRQIVCSEKLELLALGRSVTGLDGVPIRDAIDAVSLADAVPIVPWGVGKWSFGRGKIVSSLLEDPPGCQFFLGDNGGRPRPALPPPAFRKARRRQVRVLPGSDPLPLGSHVDKAGRYGLVLEGTVDGNHPAASVIGLVRRVGPVVRSFGGRTGLWGFLRSQAAMALGSGGGPRTEVIP